MTKRPESTNAGLRIDPNSADCLTGGYLFLTTGEFSKSIADDSKSISLGKQRGGAAASTTTAYRPLNTQLRPIG